MLSKYVYTYISVSVWVYLCTGVHLYECTYVRVYLDTAVLRFSFLVCLLCFVSFFLIIRCYLII